MTASGSTSPAAETSDAAQRATSDPAAANTGINTVLFVDPRVANWQELASSVSASTKVIVIDPTKDGLEQVTRALEHLHGIKEVDFLTYGQSGEIELGSSVINDAVINANATEIAGWSNSLTSNAQIQFWGCDVGAGAAGAAFVNDLHSITGAGVAASTDPVGAAALGGDWTLERTAGTVMASSPFSAAAEASYDFVLDTPTPTVGFTNVPTSVLLGNSFTETVTFYNNDTTAAGYAPFIELFVPSSGGTGVTEAATLTSATYLGAAVSYQTITLSDQIAGHVGTLGAVDPSVLNASGVAQFVAAPTGFKSGDTMYVLTLPFGSFTPGQPTANVNLTFSVNSRSDLSSLNVAAIGGFTYGASATGGVASIRGFDDPTSAPVAADGLATASSTVSPIIVTTQVTTYPGEGETATGPSFPGSYVVSLTPAPATNGDPLQNFVYTFQLPNDVEYTGGTISVTGGGTAVYTAPTNVAVGGDPTGGTITVTYSSLASASASASAVASTISIPFFVPQKDNNGNQILSNGDATNTNSVGAPTPISLNPTYSYDLASSGTWAPTGGFFGTGAEAVSGSGDVQGDPAFTAKSIAIQVTDNIGTNGLLPAEAVTYTIHFQVSDYYDLANLIINDVLGDGMTLLPGTSPTLTINNDGTVTNLSFGAITDAGATVNGQSVSTNGTNTYWNYARNNSGSGVADTNLDSGTLGAGSTGLQFNVGALYTTLLTGGTGGGSGGTLGTTGTITFYATSLNKYTETNSLQSIREGDSATDTVQATTSGGTITSQTTSNSHTQYDGSSVTNTEAIGNMTLAIDQIADSSGTLISTSNFDFQAGDLVTYTLTYTLTAGDYGDLNLNAFLPLPVFNVPGSLTNDGVGLAAGTFKILSNPSTVAGNNPTTATGTASSNSINFNFGTYDTTNVAAGQKVQVQFTVQASSNPFVNGLLLTTQGQSKYTPYDAAPNTIALAAAIQQQHILEPELTIKTGVVSDVNQSGTATSYSSGDYTPDTGASAADPTAIFMPAGTGTGTSGDVFSGSIPATLGDAVNQNFTGANAGDTARIVEAVQNTGGGNAYNVVVNGTLPTGYSASNVTNFQITRGDGTVLTYTGTLANFFSGTGITINGSGGTGATPVLTARGNAADILYITYDLALATTAAPASTLVPAGAIVNWSASNGATGFVTNGGTTNASAVGDASTNLSDTATITTTAAGFTKTITAGDDSTNVPLNNVVVGETLTYTFTLTLPEGEMTSVNFADTLPSFLDASTATLSSAPVLSSGVSSTVTVASALSINTSTGAITANFGNITNANHDASGTLTFSIQVKVANSTNVDGSTITNTGTFTSTNSPTLTSSATATEKDPRITETLTPSTGSSAVYSGETVTYTLTLTNSGDAPAQNVADSITLPSGLTWVNNSLTQTGGSTTGVSTSGQTLDISQLAVGATATFTFQATVNNNLAASTTEVVSAPATATSMPGAVTGDRTYNATGTTSATVLTGSFTPNIFIVDQSNGTTATDGGTAPSQSAPTGAADGTVGEIVRMIAYVQVPEGQNATALDVALPTGLAYLNDGSTTFAFYSPNGSIVSDQTAITASTGYQQTDTSGFNPKTSGNPSTVLPGSQISVNGSNVVTFNFGTLTNNANSATPNYAVVEFNALVKNVTTNKDGTTLTSSVAINAAPTGGAPSDTVTVKEPHVTVTKTVQSINEATGVVTWAVTLTNTGDTTAYGVSLNDAEPTSNANEGPITGLTETINQATNLNITSGTGASDTALVATMDLAAGKTETFKYTTTVTSVASPVPSATATVTYVSLNENNTTSSFYGSTYGSTGYGTAGSSTGERTGTLPVGTDTTLDDYDASATVGLGLVSGTAWNDVGNPLGTADQGPTTGADGALSTDLSGIILTGTWSGQTTPGSSTVTTNASGAYSFLLPDNVSTSIAAPTASGSETLVYDTSNSTTFNHSESGLTGTGAQIAVTASATSATTGINYGYRLPDTAPTISTWGSTSPTSPVTYTAGGSAVTLSSGSTGVADSQLDTLVSSGLGDYSGAVLTVARNGAANANDVFGGGGTASAGLFFSGGTVDYNGVAIGTFTMSGGTLQVTFGSGTSATTVQNVLNNVTYSNTGSSSQLASGILINATLSDHNIETGSTAGNAYQGTGGVQTSTAAQILLNIVPAAVADTFIEPNNTPATGAAIALVPSLTLTNSATFSQAVLQITPGTYQSGEDVLSFTNGTGMGNIQGVWNATNGTMTLTSSGNTATTAQWQTALQAVQYYDSSPTPIAAVTRTVTINATSTGGETINGTLATVVVSPTDDSPILGAADGSIPNATQNPAGAPSGAAGFLVSTIANSGDITDSDFNNRHDGSTGGTYGVAITHADTSEGNWWYSTNGGTTWTEFASNTMTAVSNANALHLLADANTMLYFQPVSAAWSGTISNALTFQAWDQYSPTTPIANGALTNIGTTGFGTGINQAASAYSSASDTLPVTIQATSITPVLSIVDQSNGTTATDGGNAPSQSNPVTSADATVGEIVRMKAYVQIPEGTNASEIEVTLPSGLQFLNDGSVTVALASPGGDVTSTTIDPTGNNPNIQVVDGGSFNPATYNPTAAFSTSHISVSGNTATLDLGQVTNNDRSATPDYAIIEFNAVVKNVAANKDGTTLTTSVAVNGPPGAGAPSTTVTVKEPDVTITKTVQSINEATGVVTWQDVITNTGDTTAYNVNLADSQATNQGSIAGLAEIGNAANLNVASGDGTSALNATMDLAAGKSETFTYTTTVTNTSLAVPDATATVTYVSLNENTTHTSSFYGSTYGATGYGTPGSSTGERTGTLPVGTDTTLDHYDAGAKVGLGLVSGSVWNDVGNPLNTADQGPTSSSDTSLPGIAMTATWNGQTTASTVTTGGGGGIYSFLLPDNVSASIAAPATSGSETLVYGTSAGATFNHNESGLTGTAADIVVTASASSPVTDINFAYRLPVVPTTTTFLPNLDPINQLSPEQQQIFGQGDGGAIIRYLGGREPDWLVGSDVYRALEAGIPGTANVSADVFYGSAPRQDLRYEAGTIDGGPLPPWLFFDPSLLRFSGTPPANMEGSVDLRVIATDKNGRQATAEVHIVILREPADILAMLHPAAPPSQQAVAPGATPKPAPSDTPIVPPTPPSNDRSVAPPTGDTPATPPAGNAPPPGNGNGTPKPNNDNAPPSSPSQGAIPKGVFVPGVGRNIQGFGLSPQLREQTQAGRLARARLLLNALSGVQANL